MTPSRGATRRPLGTLLLLAAALGLLTQTLVAWGIAWLHNPGNYTDASLNIPRPASAASPVTNLHISRCESWGRIWITTVATIPPTPLARSATHPGPIEALAAPWSPAQVYPPLADPALWPPTLAPATAAREVALLRADGWPLPSLWHRYTYHPARPIPYDRTGAVTIPWLRPRDPMLANLPLDLAYRPIWPALAINTLVYAVSWIPLLAVPVLLGRARRRRRGHCPACNYDLRATPPGAPCPECGRGTSLPDRSQVPHVNG